MLQIKNYINLIPEIEELINRGYASSDIAILFDLPLATAVEELLRYSMSGRIERRNMLKVSKSQLQQKIATLTERELIDMYNDVTVRKLDSKQCMLKFDIPSSLTYDVTKRLQTLGLDEKLNFLKLAQYQNKENLIHRHIKLKRYEWSLAQHYKDVYLETLGFTDEFVKECHELQVTYGLSCDELAYKFGVDYADLRSITAIYYGRMVFPRIPVNEIYQLVIQNNDKSYLLDLFERMKDTKLTDTEVALTLNVKLIDWTKIKKRLFEYLGIDSKSYELEKKNNWTKYNLAYRFGEGYTNVAQLEKVKQKTQDTITSQRVEMTRHLSVSDEHPLYYRFSQMDESQFEKELTDLIINRGYRAEDIVNISDIESTQDITKFNQQHGLITQLTTGDYETRVQAQLDKLKSASNDEHALLVQKLQTHQVSSAFDACAILQLPRRAFEHRIKFSSVNYVTVDNDEMIHIPAKYLDKLSVYESELSRILYEHDIRFELFNRQILGNKKELDFYLPDHKIGIEVNPAYTHNSNQYRLSHHATLQEMSKDTSYHYNKYIEAKECGITLIQLHEWDFYKRSLRTASLNRLLSIIKPDVKIFARNCEVREISIATAREFLDANHSNGYSNAKHKFGLFHNNSLVAVATFATPSFSRRSQYDYELKRLAFKAGTRVIGGTSKLVKHFFKSVDDANSLYSFSDNDWGNGVSYEKSGFTFVNETGPSLRYVSSFSATDVDTYSWNITTSVSSPKSVVGGDRLAKGLSLDPSTYNVDEYIECELTNRDGIHKGYDKIYTSGSKKWSITRQDLFKN